MDEPTRARAILRSHLTCTLLHDGAVLPGRYVLDDTSGRPVLPVPKPVFDAAENVLMIPEEGFDALQLLVTPERIDPDRRPWAAACDRWQAYHGRPEHQAWAAMAVDSARIDNSVLEGEQVLWPNALAAEVPGLCRRFNQRRAELAALVAAASPDRPPLLVGVDPEGLDVKLGGLFHRIPFPHAAEDAEDAAGMIESLLRGTGPGEGGGP